MRDLLQQGIAWLAGQLEANAGELFAYTQGGQQFTVPGVLGQTLLRLTDEVGATRVEWTDRDLLIRRSVWVAAGVPRDPQRGDRAQATFADGATESWEVLPYDQEPPWRWADPYRTTYRIHVKRVATVYPDGLLLEDDSALLCEDGTALLLE